MATTAPCVPADGRCLCSRSSKPASVPVRNICRLRSSRPNFQLRAAPHKPTGSVTQTTMRTTSSTGPMEEAKRAPAGAVAAKAARLQNSLQTCAMRPGGMGGNAAGPTLLFSALVLVSMVITTTRPLEAPTAPSGESLPRSTGVRAAPRCLQAACRCRAALRPLRRHAPKPEGPHEEEAPRRPRLLRRTRRSQWVALAAKLMRRRSGSTSR